MAGLKERLRRARCWHVGANLPGMKLPATKWFELSPTLPAEAADRIEELEAALRPFAEYAAENSFGLDNNGREVPASEGVGWIYLTVGDFRRARQAIAENSHG